MASAYTYCKSCNGPLDAATMSEVLRGEQDCPHCGAVLSPNRSSGEVMEAMQEMIDNQAQELVRCHNEIRVMAETVAQIANSVLNVLPVPTMGERRCPVVGRHKTILGNIARCRDPESMERDLESMRAMAGKIPAPSPKTKPE